MGQMGYPRELRLYGVLRSSAKWNSRSSTHSRVSWRWTELDRWRGSEEDQRTLTEQHGEKKVRSFAESAIFYVGIPAALLYLLLLMPLAVVGIWTSVRVSNATELAYFIGFFVFSAAAGLAIGYVRWMSAESSYYLSVLAVYVGGIAAAVCLAASQTPPLPLVEIRADRNVTLACKEVPTKNMFVMLDRSDSFLYLYNKEGLLSLPEGKADTVRFRECQGYLDRD